MADKKISALTGATTPLAGTEVLPIVQSGSTVKVAVSDLTAGRAISATQLTLTTGNVIVANGQGIDFSATPNTGTSELFNDYEEGTWTPVITGSTTNPTPVYTVQTGSYTKVGRQVTATFIIQYSSIVGGSGDVRFSLPFTGGTSVARGGPLYVFGVNSPANCFSVCLEEVTSGTAYVGFIFSVDSAAFASAAIADLPALVGSFRGQITYFV